MLVAQPSLRDSYHPGIQHPKVETLGYSQVSLRDREALEFAKGIGPRPALYWMPSSSTSNTSVLLGGIFGLGLFGP